MERLSMSDKDIKRVKILQQRRSGLITQRQAALLAGLGVRQFRRVEQAYRERGDKALPHGNLGKPSSRRLDPEKKTQILSHMAGKYKGFGPTLAAELLGDEDGLIVSAQTLLMMQQVWLLALSLLILSL